MGLPPHIKLPCRQCIGCRLETSRTWATRCVHETKSHQFNTWITLTYTDEHLPKKYNTGIIHPVTKRPIYAGSLDPLIIPRYIRKLRKSCLLPQTKINRNEIILLQSNPFKIIRAPILRYYYGAEYGEKYARPHYHICLFGISFQDTKLIQTTPQGFKLYESETAKKYWPYGNHMIGELNFETAAYTARYIMKKITGQKQKKHYEKIDADTGEIIIINPEFNEMSRDPGIGKKHYEKYKKDIYKEKKSQVRINGHTNKPPRYYDKQYQKNNPEHYKTIKFARQLDAIQKWRNHTPARLKAEETIKTQATKTLRQKL